ncbi:GNAT family N-acetyltransferase [Marinibacterium sp. SX1]|uniref:GNAT family N-acetyltransferase n=1 Tax=Marinibacterium sp. SX1 TaxID=3388424 RepID=UPI003D17FDE4
MTAAPIIDTARTRLRPHVLSDMEAFWDFFQSPRAEYVDGPSTRTHLWYGFASETGSWALCGHGGWAIETRDGALAGQVCISQPPHFPELELGWILFDGFEGRGLAFEAASAARDYAFAALGVPTLVSYIDRRNTRSCHLAERLGAVVDPEAKSYDDADVVYRHRPAAEGVA